MSRLKLIVSSLLFLTATFLLSTGFSYAGGSPPSVPGNLQGVVAGDQVKLTWTASSNDDGQVGYNVYFNDNYIDTVFNTFYTTTLDALDALDVPDTQSGKASFYLHAFDPKPHLYSQRSEELVLQVRALPSDIDNPPSAPGNLIGAINSIGEVVIAWDASSDDNGVSHYDVYRDGVFRKSVTQRWYREANGPNDVRSWQVVARDSSGNESQPSRQIRLPESVVSPMSIKPTKPTQVRASVANGRVTVLWNASSDDKKIRGYNVYRDDTFVKGVYVGTSYSEAASTGINPQRWKVVAFDYDDNYSEFSDSFTLEPLGSVAPFSLQVQARTYQLIEGAAQYLSVPIALVRSVGFNSSIRVSAMPESDADRGRLDIKVAELGNASARHAVRVKLPIDNLPIKEEQIRLTIKASAAEYTQTATVTLQVTPVQSDDVYLLIGQSNMVGSSEWGAKRKGPGEPDEPNPRIVQFNFKQNSGRFEDPMSENLYFQDKQFVGNDLTYPAEDPLHEPYQYKNNNARSVGMGLSFAKTALQHTTQRIVLVPAAYSATGFCDVGNLPYYWNAYPTGEPGLGQNTALYDRAVRRVNEVLDKTGGILRGILWHQGENDSLNAQCANLYQENLVKLVKALRSNIRADLRGVSARGDNSDVPFVVGTMSKGKGSTPADDFSVVPDTKLIVDSVHRNISSLIEFSAVTNNDDLVPPQYPCGSQSCVHFGAAALREMGVRTYDSLIRAAGD